MGAVTEHLRDMVERQIKEHNLVVWFDPEGHYCEFVEGLTLPEGEVEVCGESFFELRHRVEPYIGVEGDGPPKLLVYVPRGQEDTRNALVEFTEPGVVMKPGRHSHNLNTRLAVVAKRALKDLVGDGQAAGIQKDVEAGRMGLEDLERLGETTSNLVSLIFGTAYPHEVALKFLGGHYDVELSSKGALPDLATLFGGAFGVSLPEASLDEMRAVLSRHLLTTELVHSLPPPLPQQLSSVSVAEGDKAEACASLAHAWRNRLDLRGSYADHADRVEQELSLIGVSLDLDQLRACQTFAVLEGKLQTAIEESALEGCWTGKEYRETIDLIGRRLQGFWASWPERYPEVQPRWQLLESVVKLLHTADRIQEELDSLNDGPEELLRRYTAEEEPWCELDTHHRHMERRHLDLPHTAHDETPEKLASRSRKRYLEAAEAISGEYLRALRDAGFRVRGFPQQTEVFEKYVAPALERGRVAYVLVDALRYEMARELARALEGGYDLGLSAAVATVPTITEIGMAALMPGAGSSAEVVPAGRGKLGLEIEDRVLSNREERVKWLQEWAGPRSREVYAARLEDLYAPSQKTKSAVQSADLVLATSREIDQQGESGAGPTARHLMDEVLSLLPRAIRQLAELGCGTIFVCSDHGYVFADELDPGMKIDPPGGQTEDLHRRVWVGVGGSDEPSFLRAPLSYMGLGELEIAVPWGFGAFRVRGGSEAYFHGGMSVQEMAVPVISLTAKKEAESAGSSDVEWEIKLGSEKISTRTITVRVGGSLKSLLAPALPRLRVEVRAGGAVISEPISAAYGYSEATRDFEVNVEGEGLEKNSVTLMLEPEESPGAQTASVHLLDSTTGVDLARIEGVELSIAV